VAGKGVASCGFLNVGGAVGCFAEGVWICLIAKGLMLFARTRQQCDATGLVPHGGLQN
jgi:hypothetical protein